MNRTKTSFLPALFAILISPALAVEVRHEIHFPDLEGYQTMACDLHMHTVFSDGLVWPQIRVSEAWSEGLDAISLSEHIEYQAHKDDIPLRDHNRAFELAKNYAEDFKFLLIHGAEITRAFPPGHLNAIFIQDANSLDTEDYRDALRISVEQGGFVFWNHPGYIKDLEAQWVPEMEEIYKNGWIQGIEVINGDRYYVHAHKWCLEKNLVLIGTSDVHGLIHLGYDLSNGGHRPMTLVFAKERTAEAIKEALLAGRTAIFSRNLLIGDEKYLKAIFEASVEILTPEIEVSGKGRVYVMIRNKSDIPFELEAHGIVEGIRAYRSIMLYPDKTTYFYVQRTSQELKGRHEIRLPYIVKNLYVKPAEGMPVELVLNVNFK